MNYLEQILNEEGRLIIKKDGEGKMMVAIEIEIDGREHHVGHRFKTVKELYRDWNKICRVFMIALRRTQCRSLMNITK